MTLTPAGLAMSLVGGVRSVGLVSQSEQALKKYAHRLLACVRSIDDAVVVDEYSGQEFLNLISRLNQEVAPYLQQQAQPPGPTGPIHLWVIDHADQLSTEQQTIIFRLIALFPALPFRVIWLSRQPLQAWKEHAKTECVFLDLDAIAPAPAQDGEPKATSVPVDADAPAPMDAADADAHTEASPQGAVSRHPLKITAGLLIAGLIGAWAWRSAVAPDVAPQQTEVTATAAQASGAATPAATTASEAGAATTPQPMASEAPASPAVQSASPAGTALPQVVRTGVRWLKGLPADTLVVEHGAFNNLDQAQKLKDKHKELATARIIAVRKAANADEWQYSVVTGPFRSEDRAKTYVSRLDWRVSTRIRSTDKLQALLATSP